MKAGLKTNILFELVKVGYLEQPNENILKLIEKENVDNKTFIHYLAYHGLRPVALNAIKTLEDNSKIDELSSYLEAYNLESTFQNLKFSSEICRILYEQQNLEIRILPYKGNLFLYEFYKNKQLRECGDVDFLIHPEDLKKSLNWFLDDGYEFILFDSDKKKLTNDIIINGLLSQKNDIEVGLVKNDIFLDIHWGLHYRFLPYKINYEGLFLMTEKREFYNKTLDLPKLEAMFLDDNKSSRRKRNVV